MDKIINNLYSKIQKKLAKVKLEAMDCHCIWGGGQRFKIEHHMDRFVVDLGESVCGCAVWDLTGISCCHTADVVMYARKKAKHFVSAWYNKQIFSIAYEHLIEPVPCMKS